MSNPAGWYPQPDGQQRYWDGDQWTENFAPGAGVVVAPPARKWFKKKRFILPAIAVLLIVVGSSFSAGSGTPSTIAQAPVVAASPAEVPATEVPATEAPVVEAPVVEAPAVEAVPVVTTCQAVAEALLTGTPAQVTKAMKALIKDRTADSTAREYARYYTIRDKNDKDMRSMDESLISMSCN